MDTLTHLTVGACLGEAAFSRRMGKQALIWGAIAQNLPDIDTVSSVWLSTSAGLVAHRGLTHSLLFLMVVAPAMAWYLRRLYGVSFWPLCLFFAGQIALHDFLDLCNSYGTGLLEPFSHARFSLNLLYVVDPLFTVGPLVATIVLIWKRKTADGRKAAWMTGLSVTLVYFGIVVTGKQVANSAAEEALRRPDGSLPEYFLTPTPFNGFLWYAVADTGDGYRIGYRSVFDKGGMSFGYRPRHAELLKGIEDTEEVRNLRRFARGYFTVEKQKEGLEFNVLRFGQIRGWENPDAPFTFHFYLSPGYSNELVMQRGRFSGWNQTAVIRLINRIAGHPSSP